jgi:predicted ATP-grasp superfamily ATP-dependent carboligase
MLPSTTDAEAARRPGADAGSRTVPRPRKILLLDGYSTRTLACVRSWGRRGIAFAVGGETRWDLSLFSRYARETFVYTSPKRDRAKFIEDVNRYSRQFDTDCVLPTSEAAIMACGQGRADLRCVPLIPSQHEIDTVFSKAEMLQAAQAVGIAVPQTVHITPQTAEILARIDPTRFPVVIKSESSELLLPARAATSAKTAYAFSRDDVVRECRARLDDGQGVLVQDFIDGYGLGISGLFDRGRAVALLGHRRVRESNPMGGPSAVAETIEMDPALLTASMALMRRIGFSGPAMVEFKMDRRTGRPYFMEINGRFWGSVLLGPLAGLDLPYLYWKMVNGIEVGADETRYRVGVRGRYLVGDTKCLLLCLKGKPKQWPGDFPPRRAALASYLHSFIDRHTHDLLLTRDDPAPFMARLIQGPR